MNIIDPVTNDSAWQSNLIKDLSFIKEHLRYPIHRKGLLMVVLRSFLAVSFQIILLLIWWFRKPYAHLMSIAFVAVSALLVILIIFNIINFIKPFVFKSIRIPFNNAENGKLIQQFLAAKHLAYSRHPESEDIFQIISKNVSFSGKDQREVMTFIADNSRILVNGHFTRRNWALEPPSKHYKVMVNELEQWLKNYHVHNPNISVTSF